MGIHDWKVIGEEVGNSDPLMEVRAEVQTSGQGVGKLRLRLMEGCDEFVLSNAEIVSLLEWMMECVELDPSHVAETTNEAAWTNYRDWCTRNNVRGLGRKSFGSRLKARPGVQQGNNGRSRYWTGFQLVDRYSQGRFGLADSHDTDQEWTSH